MAAMSLSPRTEFTGPALEFDFPGVEVGVAEYDEGPTGCTVLHFPAGAATAIDARGGLVGTVGNWEWNHAICLAGGSLFGLEAAAGVHAALTEDVQGPIRIGGNMPFKFVSGAIIFDFGLRENTVAPDYALGMAAAKACQAGLFPLGARGAGRSATVGKFLDQGKGIEPSGQGAAFRRNSDLRVLVCSVVNSLGAVMDRDGTVVRGHLNHRTGKRERVVERVGAGIASASTPQQNTTLTIVVTNGKLIGSALTQFGRQIHASMARAIEPFHTSSDGDVLYAVTTAATDLTMSADELGVIASELAWDAVLAAVR
jgi:L-aminopeptidase/D-esterase-like protein